MVDCHTNSVPARHHWDGTNIAAGLDLRQPKDVCELQGDSSGCVNDVVLWPYNMIYIYIYNIIQYNIMVIYIYIDR